MWRGQAHAAREHLRSAGYGDGSASEQVDGVARAVFTSPAVSRRMGLPAMPSAVDAAAALALLSEARKWIEVQELHLTGRARAQGATWEQIATLLGLHGKASAQRRYATLRKSGAGYRPPRERLAGWLPGHAAAVRAMAAALLAVWPADAPRLRIQRQDLAALVEAGPGADAAELYWTLYRLSVDLVLPSVLTDRRVLAELQALVLADTTTGKEPTP